MHPGNLPRRQRRETGAAAVEFALVMPLLLMLILGIVSYGYLLSFRQAISQGASEGARAAAVSALPTQDQKVIQAVEGMNDALSSYGVQCQLPTGATTGALGLGLVSFTIGVDVKVSASSAAGSPRSTTITVPSQQFDTAYAAGSGSLSLATGTVTRTGLTVSATLLGLPVTLPTATVDAILSAVTTIAVTPLLNSLDSQVVMPLADLAGARVAGADVIALSKPNCSVPVLRQ